MAEGRISCRLLCAEHSYAESVPANPLSYYQNLHLLEINARCGRMGGGKLAIFHFTVNNLYYPDLRLPEGKIIRLGSLDM